MSEIPERAFVIAERLRERQSSEAQIRAALAEFELNEKQIKQVLKKTATDDYYTGSSGTSRGAVRGHRGATVTSIAFSKQARPSRRITRSERHQTLGSLLDDFKDMFAGMLLRFLYIAIVLALIFACSYYSYMRV